MKPVLVPPEEPGTAALIAIGQSLDAADTALSTQDPAGEIWPSSAQLAWHGAVETLKEALWLAEEARAQHEREAVSRAREAGYKCCTSCLRWRPEEQLVAIEYGAESANKGGAVRRYFKCSSCLEHEGDHGEIERQQHELSAD